MRVFCIGDSLTLGKGDAERLGWVGRLPMIDDVEYYNLGVAGQTIAQILERAYHEISARMVPYHDNLIIMGGGLNDLCLDEESKLRTDREILKAQIDAWMGAMKHLAPTLCIGPLPISEDYNPYFNSTLGKDVTFKNVVIDEFDAIYSQTSAAHDVPYLSLYHLLKDDPSYKDALNDGDGIHPSEMGYVGIAEYLSNWKALRSHLPDAKANKEKK